MAILGFQPSGSCSRRFYARVRVRLKELWNRFFYSFLKLIFTEDEIEAMPVKAIRKQKPNKLVRFDLWYVMVIHPLEIGSLRVVGDVHANKYVLLLINVQSL